LEYALPGKFRGLIYIVTAGKVAVEPVKLRSGIIRLVMGFKPLGKDVAQIHFFTVGSIKDLANDMQYFYKYLKNKGINTVYDSIPAPITIQMFQQLGAKVMQSDNPKYKFKAQI